ncbi:translation initiation factor IF-5A [Candidatus Pacearchaeota archaeon]|nr:translation initiation factor IF-5A [Candidatus Pacearchaeota archaeon]
MVKLISATEARSGATILVEGVACVVRSNDISKTGKHGHAKCRIEAIGIIDGKKRVFVTGGHERIEVPNVSKNKAQVLNMVGDDKASIMDLESYETIEVPMMEDLKGQVAGEDQVEYWDIEGVKIIKRKL